MDGKWAMNKHFGRSAKKTSFKSAEVSQTTQRKLFAVQ